MANDQGNSGDGKKPQTEQGLSDEVVARIKHNILFGEGHKPTPKSTRFQKGQSGNPAGRPKRIDLGQGCSRSANALALKEAERLINVREGEEVRQIPTIEAVLRAQIVSATRGNAYAQKHFTERYDRAEREKRQQRMNEIEIWKDYVAEHRQAIADAEAKGEKPPTPLPHPDDVLIDYEKGVRFIGPVDEEEVAKLEETLKMRDLFIMQDVHDRRLADAQAGSDLVDQSSTALAFAVRFNQCVPQRHRLSDTEIILLIQRHEATPKRTLLKQVYRGWRSLGVPVRRGQTLPPLRVVQPRFDQINELLAEHLSGQRA